MLLQRQRRLWWKGILRRLYDTSSCAARNEWSDSADHVGTCGLLRLYYGVVKATTAVCYALIDLLVPLGGGVCRTYECRLLFQSRPCPDKQLNLKRQRSQEEVFNQLTRFALTEEGRRLQ